MLVWHYTSDVWLPEIMRAAALLPHDYRGIGMPVLWFSANQTWEPGAASLFKTRAFSRPAVRFGLSHADPRLLSWDMASQLSGEGRKKRRIHEALSRSLGCNASRDWCGALEPIPLRDLRIETCSPGERWRHFLEA